MRALSPFDDVQSERTRPWARGLRAALALGGLFGAACTSMLGIDGEYSLGIQRDGGTGGAAADAGSGASGGASECSNGYVLSAGKCVPDGTGGYGGKSSSGSGGETSSGGVTNVGGGANSGGTTSSGGGSTGGAQQSGAGGSAPKCNPSSCPKCTNPAMGITPCCNKDGSCACSWASTFYCGGL